MTLAGPEPSGNTDRIFSTRDLPGVRSRCIYGRVAAGAFRSNFFEVQVKNRSIRTVLAGLLCMGLAAGFLGPQSGQADAQAQTLNAALRRPFPGAGSTFLANVSWQPMDAPMVFGPQQDQSMPGYRQAKPPKPQPDTPNSSVPSAQASGSNSSDEAFPPFAIVPRSEIAGNLGSTYIPLDSWIYPALMRLYSLGYLDRAFVDMRPWTRLSVLRMLFAEQEKIHSDRNDEQALEIYNAVMAELESDTHTTGYWTTNATLESLYERAMPIGGTPLHDSYHLGQTIINDYGRPYEQGFNNYSGFSARATSGPFALYVRGEYQHVPSAAGYSPALAATLAAVDGVPDVPQATIPAGPIPTLNYFRLIEANFSATFLNHDFSIGKSDVWDGPATGGAFDWSNNAENIYSFRINRIEPLHIPLLSYVMGPVRYEFLVGSLMGHTYPNDPWVHMERFAFNPSANFEYGFSRTVIWGGEGHAPITLGTFWNSFTSFQNVSAATKFSRNDPGARFSTFDFTLRLPYASKLLTLYTDSEVHDDVTPVSAPHRAGIRAGLYLARFPGAPKLDLRGEGVYTDVPVSNSNNGSFMYYETVQRQGYTNQGNIFGDWIGREAKGGQAWLTYHLSAQEILQLSYRNAKAAKDFIPGNTFATGAPRVDGGTTQNDFTFT
ncbi:MAG: capsule assembly Wzi family protein, partial [Acidobacteriaceae bacterium]